MNEVLSLVREFSAAHDAAQVNTQVMCGQPTGEEVRQCEERMRRLISAEKALLGLTGDLPTPLKEFLDAHNDRGCVSCRVSHRTHGYHHECALKMCRYFRCRDNLLAYGRELS